MSGRKQTALILGPIVLCALIVFWLNLTYLQNHFYTHGAYILDSAWYVALPYRPQLFLLNPLGIETLTSFHYFAAYHFSPFWNLAGWPSWVLPVDRLEWGFFWFALQYALLALGVSLACSTTLPDVSAPVRGVLAALAGLGIAFAGPVVRAIGYPHFEIFFPAFAILFFWAWATGRTIQALIYLTLALFVREDAGLHLFGFFFIHVTYERLFRRQSFSSQRPVLILAAVAFAYGVAATFGPAMFIPVNHTLTTTYLGDPPLAHLSAHLIVERIAALLASRSDLLFPALIIAGVALWRGRLDYLVGVAAVVPWIALNLIATNPAAPGLTLYYGFPLIVSLAWPFIAEAWRPTPNVTPRRQAAFAVAMFAAYASSAYVMWRVGDMNGILRAMTTPPTAEARATGAAVRVWLESDGPQRDNFVVDSPVAALAIDDVRQDTMLFSPTDDPPGDGVVYFASGYASDGPRNYRLRRHLTQHFRVGDGPIWISTTSNGNKETIEKKARAIAGGLPITLSDPTFFELQTSLDSERSANGIAMKPGKTGVLSFGPYARLEPGRYQLTYTFGQATPCADWTKAQLEVQITADSGKRQIASQYLTGPALDAFTPCQGQTTLAFDVTPDMTQVPIEWPVYQRGAAPVTLKLVSFERLPG